MPSIERGAFLIKLHCPSSDDTMAVGERIGLALSAGSVITLDGELGSGKTTLTKGIARGLDIHGELSSPSYTIIDEYEGRLPLYHMDAYRLSGSEDFIGTGGEEYLWSQGVCVIEWGERIKDILPSHTWKIRIVQAEDASRSLLLEGKGLEEIFYEDTRN